MSVLGFTTNADGQSGLAYIRELRTSMMTPPECHLQGLLAYPWF